MKGGLLLFAIGYGLMMGFGVFAFVALVVIAFIGVMTGKL